MLKKQNEMQGLCFFFFCLFFLYEVKKLSWALKTSQLHENPELTWFR